MFRVHGEQLGAPRSEAATASQSFELLEKMNEAGVNAKSRYMSRMLQAWQRIPSGARIVPKSYRRARNHQFTLTTIEQSA
jgi:hypothetical protein